MIHHTSFKFCVAQTNRASRGRAMNVSYEEHSFGRYSMLGRPENRNYLVPKRASNTLQHRAQPKYPTATEYSDARMIRRVPQS
jgi:hypothetical protein